MLVSSWRVGTAALAVVAAIFHLWLAARMPLSSVIGQYFALSGAFFILGAILVLPKGRGILFDLGAVGVFALSVIDNGLLYYTRTFGLGFLFGRSFRPPPVNGSFSRSITGNLSRPGLGGAAFSPRVHGGIPWSTSWIPPGSVQFFVLQCAIIIVAAIALWEAHSATGGNIPAPAVAAA